MAMVLVVVDTVLAVLVVVKMVVVVLVAVERKLVEEGY